MGVAKRDDLFDFLKRHEDLSGFRVSDLSLGDLPVVGLETTSEELLEIFLRSGKNKVMVTDDSRVLLGIVTLLDLVSETDEILRTNPPFPIESKKDTTA